MVIEKCGSQWRVGRGERNGVGMGDKIMGI